ncbi:MAG TPA: hypothetical protein VJP86_01585 [Vicinamibacterales bacterium]|nr:hypothetical protein [Vicinamibacterales bacterium]
MTNSARAAGLAVALLIVGSTAVLFGQRQEAPAGVSARTASRTPVGQPDLQGMWVNGTLTPFERPVALGEKAFYTEQEAADQERQAAARRAAPATRRPGDVGSDNEAFVDTGYKMTPTRQTSLVTDPPDGRIPFLPAAEERRTVNLNNVDTYETMSPWDRCITRGPTALFPAGYNNGYQIVQTRDYVVIVAEMIHEARIIPLDNSPHLPSGVRTWNGDPRGHWENGTLVVDSTNFNGTGWFSTHAGSGRLRGTPYSPALHLVERFTRVGPDRLDYSMTIEDPNVYSRPWTVSIPFTKDDGYQMFEYACHEGNQAVGLVLRGARTLERDTQAGAR